MKNIREQIKHLANRTAKYISEHNECSKLAKMIFGSMLNYRRGGLIKESTNSNPFEGIDSWTEFEKHARLIGQILLSTSGKERNQAQEQIDKAIINIRNVFKALAGGGNGKSFNDKDFNTAKQRLADFDSIIKKSGLIHLKPPFGVKDLIDIFKPKNDNKNGENSDDYNFSKKVNSFLDMIKGRDRRKFYGIIENNFNGAAINKTKYSIKQFITGTIKPKNVDADDIIEIFQKILTTSAYKKSNIQSIGDGEIALAMFFGDCSLPEGNGDITITSNGGKESIEVKGLGGDITKRTELCTNELKNQTWSGLQGDYKEEFNAQLFNYIKLNNHTNPDSNSLKSWITQLDKLFPNGKSDNKVPSELNGLTYKNLLAFKFVLLFSSLLTMNSNSDKNNFSKFLFLNSKKDNLDGGMMVIDVSKDAVKKDANGNWFEFGLTILNKLVSSDLELKFASAHGSQFGFKIFGHLGF